MRIARFLLSGLLLVVLLAACTPKTATSVPPPTSAPTTQPSATGSGKTATPAAPAWQKSWENTLEGAKREGKVVVWNPGGFETTIAMSKIGKMQGLNVEVVSGRTPEFLTRVLAERKAGLYLWDAYVGGYPSSILDEGKPGGILDSIDPALILPDLTDGNVIQKTWYQGQFPWLTKNHTVFRLSLQAQVPMVVNTNLVKDGELKSYRDLLNPKWKDKLIVADPTIAGAGQQSLWGIYKLMGESFVRELAATKPLVLRDQRQQLEWVAQGKAAIAVAPQPESLIGFLKIGAPMKVVIPQEGTWLSAGGSGVVMVKNAPNPNAVKVFINMLASKEGQEIWAPASYQQSLRLDVSTAHLPPERVRTEGVKYVDVSTEELTYEREKVMAPLAKELFGALVR